VSWTPNKDVQGLLFPKRWAATENSPTRCKLVILFELSGKGVGVTHLLILNQLHLSVNSLIVYNLFC